MKSLFAFILLAVFSVIIVPKEWSHDCQHQHHDISHEHHDDATLLEDCSICDFEFSPKEPKPHAEVPSESPSFSSYLVHTPKHPSISVLERKQGRAPPVFT